MGSSELPKFSIVNSLVSPRISKFRRTTQTQTDTACTMAQSYADYDREYNAHLAQVRSHLAAPTNNNASDVRRRCERALRDAKRCVAAMRGLADVEGDPFKAEETRRKLEREIGPLEAEVRARKGGAGGIASAFGGSADERYLFGSNESSYAAPSVTSGLSDDFDMEEGSMAAPLTATEQRINNSERLLRETQALCAGSEQVGAATLETMGRQREQIGRTSGLIDQSLENVQQARQIMKEM